MNETLASYKRDIDAKEQPVMGGLWRMLDESARRILDLVIALTGVIFLAPLFILIAVLIKRDTPGPIFYWGERIGRHGRPFSILKFRTMYEVSSSYNGPRVTAQGDPRITPLGKWLRDTKLNELPQLWNVLKGDMSVVGPRPEDRAFVNHWPEDARQVLLSVRPGITSPASVLYRDEENMLQSSNVADQYLKVILPSKMRLDLLYVHHRSILTDLDVIFWTLMALLPQLKSKHVPEHLLFWGPLARFINHYFSWFVLDSLVAFAAAAITGVIWRSNGPLELGLGLAVGVAVAIALAYSLVNALLGIGRIVWSRADINDMLTLAFSTSLTTAILLLINMVWEPRVIRVPYLGHHLLPSGLLVVTGLLSFVGFAALRYRMRIITGLSAHWITLRGRSAAVSERVLVVGAGEAGQLAAYLMQKAELGQVFSIVGLVDDAPRKQGSRIAGYQVLGNTSEIPQLVDLHDIGLIIFAIERIQPRQKERILSICRSSKAQVVVLPDVLEGLRTQLNAERADAGFDTAQPLSVERVNAESINPTRFSSWLSDLDELIEAEAWDDARAQVQAMREQMVLQERAG